ncbi:MAG TPA: alanine racemase [Gammaproteobacteria bacterium]
MSSGAILPGRPARAVIDLGALRHNLAVARRAAPHSRIMAAVKANGYGHGLVRVARALEDADAFGVAALSEAVELREAGIAQPIVLLEGFFHGDELAHIARLGLEVALHHLPQLEALERFISPAPVSVWIKIDTGMHRLGFAPEQVAEVRERLLSLGERARLRGFMTHFANADDRNDAMTLRQLEQFTRATVSYAGERASANSAGLLGWPQSHADWVRPGIMLYGASPFIGRTGVQEGLRPVMTLHSELIAVNTLKAGDAVGYGGSWRCPEPMKVGVVAIGYGDGYPRHVPTGTPVLVNGKRVPLVGRVSMDMITVDLRTQPEARVGDPVVLWGEGLPVEEITESAGTISYDLLCRITRRVPIIEQG